MRLEIALLQNDTGVNQMITKQDSIMPKYGYCKDYINWLSKIM